MVKKVIRKKSTIRKKTDLKRRLINANIVFGGRVINKSNLVFEVDAAFRKKKAFQKAAQLTRAMTAGHSFSDGNKRTAIVATTSLMHDAGFKADKKKLVKAIIRLSRSGEGNLKKIERSLKRCTKK